MRYKPRPLVFNACSYPRCRSPVHVALTLDFPTPLLQYPPTSPSLGSA